MIEVARDGALWRVTLARPDKANALNRAMLERLAEVMEQAQGQARVLVLSGQGKVFSAGMDLSEAETGLATDPVWETLSGRIASLPCLTIACLNGTAAGGSLGMVLACDLRLSVPPAKIFYPVMKLGFLPQPSDPGRLAGLVGPARARQILMAGRRIPAAEAQTWGLIDRVVESTDMDAEISSLSEHALGADPAHIGGIKRLLSL